MGAARVAAASHAAVTPGCWRELPAAEADGWTTRLHATSAEYPQYPYWNEPYRRRGYVPHYLIYRGGGVDQAYACVLTAGARRYRIGLLARGPVSLRADGAIHDHALAGLVAWARSLGCILLRCTHPDYSILARLARHAPSESFDAYPFIRDPRKSLLVFQGGEEETLRSFQNVARYEIRAAERAGYEIVSSDDPHELARAWPMLESLAKRKGIVLSARSRTEWLEVVRRAAKHGCARQYSAVLNSARVQTLLVLRYGETAEYMLGALDFDAVKGRPSPSCLAHWAAMRDFYRLGCYVYNLGGPGDGTRNLVFQFKRKFHPSLRELPAPITLTLDAWKYRLWKSAVIEGILPWRSRFRRLRAALTN